MRTKERAVCFRHLNSRHLFARDKELYVCMCTTNLFMGTEVIKDCHSISLQDHILAGYHDILVRGIISLCFNIPWPQSPVYIHVIAAIHIHAVSFCPLLSCLSPPPLQMWILTPCGRDLSFCLLLVCEAPCTVRTPRKTAIVNCSTFKPDSNTDLLLSIMTMEMNGNLGGPTICSS